ncbi:uncharacterized protein LOC130724635 isoform X3 [Lotus japonicus]|uniref:uncharacterized protein LOC130724635 isoform X3 n=1 Tax=Lotus japonicus TaxID=34305 RepID=UPI0025904FCC|nr:uncharacterized protein LOC130724635 isoform X3 [Lotus japonicus]
MREKHIGARRPSPNPSATVPSPSSIPLLSTVNQDQHTATVFDSDGDDNVPMTPDHRPEPEPVDLFDEDICIGCDQSEGTLLVCSEKGCPIAIHASCIGSEPKFDASGSFYCPYCWYKRAVNDCRQLRQKAMMAKEALTSFLDSKPQLVRQDDGEEHVAEPGVPPVPAQDMSREEPVTVPETGETGGLEGIERCEEHIAEPGIPPGQDLNREEPETASGRREIGGLEGIERCEEHVAEPGVPPAQDLNWEEPETAPGRRETRGLEGIERCETAREEEGKESSTGSFMSETNDSDYDASLVKKRRAKRKVAAVKKSLMESNVGDENGEVSSTGTSRKPKQQVNRILLTGKRRRRLYWTDDEEKALKQEGVLKFSLENQNIPWRKILEFGCGTFDKTRAPSDLKDKWKKMISKQGCK